MSDNAIRDEETSPLASPLFLKGRRVLEEHRLRITKSWLARIIAQIEDLGTLERFPTQESIRLSVDLVGGLANALVDDDTLAEFSPGGSFYHQAASLGEIQASGSQGLITLSQSMLALEDAIWSLLIESLRKEDRELLLLVMRLRQGLQAVTQSSMETYYKSASSELDRLAHTDALTGLSNRRYMLQELERHIELYKRYRHTFALLMIDLDNLKGINDTYGHSAGDLALRHAATMMGLNVRDVDICARFGGDEFIILMPETSKDVVRVVGDRIAESLLTTKLKVDSSLLTLRLSAGCAACPEDGRETEQLLQEADASLYRAKQHKAIASGE